MVFSMISEQIPERLYVMDIRDNYIIGMISSFFLVLQTTSRRYLIKNVPLQFPSPPVILITSERSLKRLFQHYKVSLYTDYLYL